MISLKIETERAFKASEWDAVNGILDAAGVEANPSLVERVSRLVDRDTQKGIKMAAIHEGAGKSRGMKVWELRKLLTNIWHWSRPADGG